MTIPQDEIDELDRLWPGVAAVEEQDRQYFVIPGVRITGAPSPVTLLLCPVERDGYPCRVFFSSPVGSPRGTSWSALQIIERTWHGFSWRLDDKPRRLAQIVYGFLKAVL